MLEVLNEENYILYAMKVYDNPSCNSLEEFYKDLNQVKYIKRLLNRYHKKGELRERLILNHIITFCNIFGGPQASKLLFFKLSDELYPALKTFLSFLNLMPDIIYGARNKPLCNVDIPSDLRVTKILRNL